MLTKIAALNLCLAAALTAQTSATIQVTSAGRSGNTLGWKAVPGAAGYQLERKSGASGFAPLGAVTTETSATDSKIDVYATNTYRVRATGAAAVSNEVTVGPAPSGFNAVVPTPKDADEDFGVNMIMALDANDDPVFAYEYLDPNRNGNRGEATLYFVGWDRAHYRWRTPAAIETATQFTGSKKPLSIAADASTGQLAIAWLRDDDVRGLALSSDGGATWTKQTLAGEPENPAAVCAVALTNGVIHLAYFAPSATTYITGRTTDDSRKWTRPAAPAQAGLRYRALGDLALDNAGKPALAYIAETDEDGNMIFFWRPGSAPIRAFDTKKAANDAPDVRVAFAGEKPRLLFAGNRDETDGHNIWFSQSETGSAWSEPIVAPNDGNRGMQGPISMSFSPGKLAAVVSTDNGGNWDNVKCGWPKLSLSPDGRQWSTCSPWGTNMDNRSWNVTLAYAGDGHLYLAYRSVGPQAALVVWKDGAAPVALSRPATKKK